MQKKALGLNASAGELVTVFGTDGDDTIDLRGTGIYYVRGLAGDDTIFADDIGSDLHGGQGNDTHYGGAGGDALEGGDGDDVEYGYGGNDRGFVLRGDDFMDGGAGADTLVFGYYYIDTEAPDDPNIENPYAMTYDLLWQGLAIDLGVFGTDTFLNFENITGGNGADRFWGTNAANDLSGGAGADLLAGRGGNDRIFGGTGADRIYGNAGRDVMAGGQEATYFAAAKYADGARDVFIFSAVTDSPASAPDVIYGFERGLDRLDLTALDARSVSFVYGGGGLTTVCIDVSGSTAFEMRINVSGLVTAADVLL